jgi:hypothetical protein
MIKPAVIAAVAGIAACLSEAIGLPASAPDLASTGGDPTETPK